MEAKRRIIFLTLVISLILSIALVSCSPQTPVAPATTEPAVVEPTATQPVAAKPLKIAVITSGPVADGGWNYLLDQGRLALEEKFGSRVETVLAENVAWGEELVQTEEALIANGVEVIIDGDSGGDYTSRVSKAHPEVKFIRIESGPPTAYANEETLYQSVDDYGYVFGATAALLTKSNKLGFVMPYDVPNIRLELNAFQLGAASVNPKAVTHVVTVNAWFDPTATRQAEEALIDAGCDVVWADMDDSTGIVVAAERGVWTFGSFTDRTEFGPDVWVTAWDVNFPMMFTETVGKILDGKWQGNGYLNFFELGHGIELAPWGPKVPPDVVAQAQALRDKIVNEKWLPAITGPITDMNGNVVVKEGEVLDTYTRLKGVDWLVPGIEGLQKANNAL